MVKVVLQNITKQIFGYPYLVLVLSPIILFSTVIFTGKSFFWGLPILQFIPWRVFLLNSIQQGVIPLWNNLNGFGAPFIANYQSAAFYPPSWILAIFYWLGDVGWLAYGFTLLTIAHLLLAGLGMVFFLRRLGLSTFAQNIGGLVFSLSGFMIYRTGFYSMIWTAAWLPWLLFAFTPNQRNEKGTWLPNIQGVIFISMLLLAGHAQLAFYSLVLTTSWVGYHAISLRRVHDSLLYIVSYSLTIILAAGISSIQLIPTAELLLNSQRAIEVGFDSGMDYSFWGWHFLNFLNPGWFGSPATANYWGYGNAWEDAVYVGVLPLVLCLVAVKHVLHKSRFQGILICLYACVILAVLLALGKFTPIYLWLYSHIPTFSMFQSPARWMFITTFCISIIAALGSEFFTRPSGRLRYWLNLSAMGAAAIGIGALLGLLVLPRFEPTIFKSILSFSAILFICLLAWIYLPVESKARNFFITGVIALLSIDLIIAAWGFQPVVDMATLQKLTRDTQSSGVMYVDSSSEYWMKFRRFFRFLDFRPVEELSDIANTGLPNLNLLTSSKSANNFDPLVPEGYDQLMHKLQMLDLDTQYAVLSRLGVNKFISANNGTPSGLSEKSLPETGVIYWSNCVKSVVNKEQAWDALIHSDKSMVIIEGVIEESLSNCSISESAVSIKSETTGNISINSNSSQPGWLVFRQTLYPGWKVSIDGKQASYYPADYLFMAVELPAGEHEVIWYYDPISYKIGGLVTLLSIIVLLYFWTFNNSREKNGI